MKWIWGTTMFYTYLRSCSFILWVLNGMPITIIRTIFQIGKRTIWYPLWWGSGLYGLQPASSSLSLWRKRTLQHRIFGWWIRMWAFDRPWKSGAEAIKYPVNMLKKQQPFLDYVSKWKPSFSRRKGGVAITPNGGAVRIMPVTYTGPRDLKASGTGERIDMNFGHPIDISILKMNDVWAAAKVRRIRGERSFLTVWCRSASDQHPNNLYLDSFFVKNPLIPFV